MKRSDELREELQKAELQEQVEYAVDAYLRVKNTLIETGKLSEQECSNIALAVQGRSFLSAFNGGY